ncbi:MAG: hypothetical protein RI959_1867 [Pseudomonadota bacterium]|jgi:cytochrome c556
MKIRDIALVGAVMLAAGGAQAQFQKPEDAVKYRQGAFTVMAAHFGRIGAMTSGRVPFDAKVLQENAAIVATVAALPFTAFTPDTEKVKSRAKPELWAEMDKVKAGAAKLVADMGKLNEAAKTGNLDAIKKTFGEAASNCKACHDVYRE